MPELPEVETVRRTLAPAVGKRVTSVWASRKGLHMNRLVPRAAIARTMTGRVLERVRRHGKFLLVDFSGDRSGTPGHVLIIHLGMTGRFRLIPAEQPRAPHTHLVLGMAGRSPDLRFSDPRRFGLVSTCERGREREHPSLAKLGVDPLEEHFDGAFVYDSVRGSKRTLKSLLLDQRVIAGIGNIYASEVLWQARLRPTRRAGTLSKARAGGIADAIHDVLARALGHGGTSLRDFVAADGRPGEHAHHLWVYDREGHACPRKGCPGTIRRTVQHGRATFFCPRCQK